MGIIAHRYRLLITMVAAAERASSIPDEGGTPLAKPTLQAASALNLLLRVPNRSFETLADGGLVTA